MKPWIKILVIAAVMGVLATLITLIVMKAGEKSAAKEKISKLPPFELTALDGSMVTRKDIKPGKPVIFLWFNSGCDHCHGEVKDISMHAELFREDAELFLVSNEDIAILKEFSVAMGLDQSPWIHVVKDSQGKWVEEFDPGPTPTNFIYDAEGRLVKKLSGEAKATYLVKLAKRQETGS